MAKFYSKAIFLILHARQRQQSLLNSKTVMSVQKVTKVQTGGERHLVFAEELTIMVSVCVAVQCTHLHPINSRTFVEAWNLTTSAWRFLIWIQSCIFTCCFFFFSDADVNMLTKANIMMYNMFSHRFCHIFIVSVSNNLTKLFGSNENEFTSSYICTTCTY